MSEEIPVKISEEVTVPGHEPIVLLGPNGSGKTRHSVKIYLNRNPVYEEDILLFREARLDLSTEYFMHHGEQWLLLKV